MNILTVLCLVTDSPHACKIRESADNKQEKLVNRSRRMARNLNFSEDRSYRNEHNARTSPGKLIWTQI